ncbi:MAG: hypothetical protein IPJ00_16415 [Saprospirales bacterium]|nr:hypothetical protein [Saprospirales bacterium]
MGAHLEKLSKEGQDEYNLDFSNTKLLAIVLEDSLILLKKLQKTYFEETGKPNSEKGKIIIQKAEKIYNINHIDKAEFS